MFATIKKRVRDAGAGDAVSNRARISRTSIGLATHSPIHCGASVLTGSIARFAIPGLALAASVVAAATVMPSPAAAFICGQSIGSTPGPVGDGAGASDLGNAAATACGAGASAAGPNATALGSNSSAAGAFATATGTGSAATGDGAVAVGAFGIANGANATAIGTDSGATGDFASAFGYSAKATGNSATATGVSASATGDLATATGASASATGTGATATGVFSQASGETATATGVLSSAIGDQATAEGGFSSAFGANASAFGAGATAASDNATAIGQGAVASGANSTALGQGAIATGDNSTAIGAGASTGGFAGSTAIGAGAQATAANQVALGTAASTVYAPGIASAASLAAQSGPTYFTTTDAAGHLAAAAFGPQDIANLYGGVAALQNQLNGIQREERRGIAAAAGMPPMITPSASGKFTVAVGGGFFQNQGAVGVTAAYRFDAPIPVYASASFANGGGSQNVFRVMGGVEF